MNDEEIATQHEAYRTQLTEFARYLRQDWKRWAFMQIKQAMIEGKHSLYLFNIQKNDWKKGKTILNFWKKDAISIEDEKYYNPETNVLITNKWLRTVIDFLFDLGLEWMPVATQMYETLTINYNQIHVLIKYPPAPIEI